MTSTQHLLYAGNYATADQPGIYAFDFDAATGVLTPRGALAGVEKPSFIAVHPDGRRLYAVSETSVAQDGVDGTVWAVDLARGPEQMAIINQQPSGGAWPCHLTLDPTGRWLLVTNYASGSVGVLPLRSDGSLGAQTDLARHTGRGPHPTRQDGPHTHSTSFTPDGRFVVVADLGVDVLTLYKLDPVTGRLQPQSQIPTRPGAGPRHMAWHPTRRLLFVANELDNTVTLYDYYATRAQLVRRQAVPTLPPDAPEDTVADIHLNAAGDRLYVSNRGHDSIAVFAVAPNGALTRRAVPTCGGRWPRNFAIAPGGRFLLVANQYSDEISVLPVTDNGDGLGAPVARAAVPGVACIVFASAAA